MSIKSFKILLTGGGDIVKDAILRAFQNEAIQLELESYLSYDDALEVLANNYQGVCVLRSQIEKPEKSLEFIKHLREAGLRTPIVVLMDLNSTTFEHDFIEHGATAAIPWNGSQHSMLRNVLNMAKNQQEISECQRISNDKLFQDFLSMQDMRDRAEEVSTQYIDLMEDYAVATEELKILNYEKDKLFSIIAHDLKSPFNALLGFSELLTKMHPTMSAEKISEYTNDIHTSATQVYRLLENLLAWASQQMNKVEVNLHDIKACEVIALSLSVLNDVAKQKNVTIINNVNNVPAHADPNFIDTIIRNFVNNAIKFTPTGGTVTVNAEQTGDFVTISVSDTGVGITKDRISKLFKLSENIKTNGTDGEVGTGLGLMLCHEMISKMGGKIDVSSVVDEGSTFSITIPAATGEVYEEPVDARYI